MNKQILITLLGLSILGIANANEKTGELKSSATIKATCLISANQIGFGVVATPLMNQSANSEMTVKCSNASAYTIDLAYGGVYGQGSSNPGYLVKYNSNGSVVHNYDINNTDGSLAGNMACGYAYSYIGKVVFTNITVANLYGYSSSGMFTDTLGACITNNTQAGTYPKGWLSPMDSGGNPYIGGSPVYSYGVMNGSFKGDSLAYSIAVPGEPTKVWNSGNNSYLSTGNGEFQIIPVVAKIVPDKSGSKYPAPDMYLDTITAIISY